MRQRFCELGGPTHPRFGTVVGLSSVLDKFVFVFRQSAPVQKYGGPKTTGVEIWAKISDILPPAKKGGNVGRMSVDILGVGQGAPLLVQ